MAGVSKHLWDGISDHGGKCVYLSGTRSCSLFSWEISKNSAIDTVFRLGQWVGPPEAFRRRYAPQRSESLVVTKSAHSQAYSKSNGSDL